MEKIGVILSRRGPLAFPGVEPAMVAMLRTDAQLVRALENYYDAPYLSAGAFMGQLKHLIPGVVVEDYFMDFLDVVYLPPGTRYRVIPADGGETLVSERDLDETT